MTVSDHPDEIRFPLTTPTGTEMRSCNLYRKTGLCCRKGTLDRRFAGEVFTSYRMLPVKDRSIFDVGANIGSFTRYALLSGARNVVAVEPEESNFECLRRNTADLDPGKLRLVRACAGLEDGETTLYLHDGQNTGGYSQLPRRGRFSRSVPAIDFRPLLAGIESIKMDCEGAEYVIGWPDLFPDSVTEIVLELHKFTKRQRELHDALLRAYRDEGWSEVRRYDTATGTWRCPATNRMIYYSDTTIAHFSR